MREIYETREEYEMAMRSGIGNNYILPMESNEEVKVLQEKLDIAVKALEEIVNYNSVAEQVDKYHHIVIDVRIIGKEALAKIKEIK